jgi:hypothetical protein
MRASPAARSLGRGNPHSAEELRLIPAGERQVSSLRDRVRRLSAGSVKQMNTGCLASRKLAAAATPSAFVADESPTRKQAGRRLPTDGFPSHPALVVDGAAGVLFENIWVMGGVQPILVENDAEAVFPTLKPSLATLLQTYWFRTPRSKSKTRTSTSHGHQPPELHRPVYRLSIRGRRTPPTRPTRLSAAALGTSRSHQMALAPPVRGLVQLSSPMAPPCRTVLTV